MPGLLGPMPPEVQGAAWADTLDTGQVPAPQSRQVNVGLGKPGTAATTFVGAAHQPGCSPEVRPVAGPMRCQHDLYLPLDTAQTALRAVSQGPGTRSLTSLHVASCCTWLSVH